MEKAMHTEYKNAKKESTCHWQHQEKAGAGTGTYLTAELYTGPQMVPQAEVQFRVTLGNFWIEDRILGTETLPEGKRLRSHIQDHYYLKSNSCGERLVAGRPMRRPEN